MQWTTDNEMIGRTVNIYTARAIGYETATIIATTLDSGYLRVRAHSDGEIIVGGLWEDC